MKKLRFCLFLTLCLGVSGNSYAVTDLNISGELDLAFLLKQLPTRDQGVTSFNLPRLNLNIEAPIRDGNAIFLQLESAEFRDGTSKRFDTQLKNAYLSLTSILPAGAQLRYGLIPDFYIELQREEWDFDFWGPGSDLALIKYKYKTWSDLGFMYQSELPGDGGEWALSVTNGEGYASDEVGPRKEAQLLVWLTRLAPFHVVLGYSLGDYEVYDANFNKKSRASVRLGYEFARGLVALEYFTTADPADAITAGKMAAGVDVVSLAATNVEGQGGSLFGRMEITEKAGLFLRADSLSPVKQQPEKNLKAISTGVSYNTSEDLRWALAFEYTDYSDAYANSIRDESQLVLATRVSF